MSRAATCPYCQSLHVQRVPRAGLIDRVLSVVYVYPFHCGHCLRRFRKMQWGKRYRRRQPA
jgi:hypothetical protein